MSYVSERRNATEWTFDLTGFPLSMKSLKYMMDEAWGLRSEVSDAECTVRVDHDPDRLVLRVEYDPDTQ